MKWYNIRMPQAPTTSITLLKALSSGTDNARWAEFCRTYEGMMRGFLRAGFPFVDADDVLQETLIALTKALPDYHYAPDTHGHFRNYLTGILKHKAEDALRRQAKERKLRDELRRHPPAPAEPAEDDSWKLTVLNAAVEQLMSDTAVNARTREVFRHVALLHEDAESVARLFGITRNNVDQIKNRMIRRLAGKVAAMTKAV